MITDAVSNEIALQDGSLVTFENINLSDLSRYPNIYAKDRVAIRKSLTKLTDEQNIQIKNFIYADTIEDAIKDLEGKKAKVVSVSTPGGTLKYENALEINGWLLQWNGEELSGNGGTDNGNTGEEQSSTVSIGRIISLGLADSVNPCALSILALVLIAIVTYNPGDRKKVLLAGLSFVLAVLIMYLIYGFLIIKAFEVVQSISSVREFLYGKLGINFILGIGAIILGVLGLKDFFFYKPGSVGTEMPLFLRPKANKLIAKVTSPLSAFGLGLFVTPFLLPCTIGPYIILGGLLAGDGFITALPSLILYNFIFVFPMLAVTIIVYIGSKKAEDVKDWKEKNVRYMHLAAGILMLLIGILMVTGKF
jgi:cytochrome c biogenesis protein CcdA